MSGFTPESECGCPSCDSQTRVVSECIKSAHAEERERDRVRNESKSPVHSIVVDDEVFAYLQEGCNILRLTESTGNTLLFYRGDRQEDLLTTPEIRARYWAKMGFEPDGYTPLVRSRVRKGNET